MVIEKTSANYIVLETGSTIIFDGLSDLSFYIKCSDSFSFTVILKFENSGEKQLLKTNALGNTITLTCINFNNPFGTGTQTPIELATFNGKKIYINFWVYHLGENSAKKVSYTFYTER